MLSEPIFGYYVHSAFKDVFFEVIDSTLTRDGNILCAGYWHNKGQGGGSFKILPEMVTITIKKDQLNNWSKYANKP
jgi:hypothetical protein